MKTITVRAATTLQKKLLQKKLLLNKLYRFKIRPALQMQSGLFVA
jgi:hypothetical protein